MKQCPCGNSKAYLDCCGRYIEGGEKAPNPESLMRSRYTAYSLAKIDYIVRTMRSYALEGFDAEAAREWAKHVKWIRLTVKHSTIDGNQGFVEFVAEYSENNQTQILKEISEFIFEDNEWFYIDGIMVS